MTVKDLQSQLIRYFDGDTNRVKTLAKSAEAIGFKLSENLEAIQKNPEQFMLIITYSDLGILSKLTEALTVLKGK